MTSFPFRGGGKSGRRYGKFSTNINLRIPQSVADELPRLGANTSDAVRAAISYALHPMKVDTTLAIKLVDSLPCGIRSGEGTCDKPAFAVHAVGWQHPLFAGHWVVLPVCKECARAAAAVYAQSPEQPD